MAFNNPSYVAKIGLPGVKGSLSIAHSTLSHCPTPAGTEIKIVDDTINGFNLKEPIQGLTINVFFSSANTVFNSNLKLKSSNSDLAIPIIHSMAYTGSSADDNAVFWYPYQNSDSIVTFVYKGLSECWINGTYYDSNNLYYVWQAINTRPVQQVFSDAVSARRDFDNEIYTKAGTVEVYNLSTMNHKMEDITTPIGGILEIIPIRDTLVVQRVTTNDGVVYQRERQETGTDVVQSNQVSAGTVPPNVWTKDELANPINPPAPIVFAEAMPPIPAQGSSDVRYNLEVWASPPVQDPKTGLWTTGGYGFHFQPIT